MDDLIGKRFGRLLIIGSEFKGNTIYYKCKCDCGKITMVKRGNLLENRIKSCGCLKKEINTKNARIMGLKNRKEMYCKVCGKKHYARGLCKNCYERERRKGLLVEYNYAS